jgi:predicted DNA-binding transcriptional regulator AlpA
MTTDKKPVRFLFKPELTSKVGLSFPSIWGKMRNGEFPAGRDVGGKTAWLESEIDEWIESRPQRKYKTEIESALEKQDRKSRKA